MNYRKTTFAWVSNISDHIYREAEFRANSLPIHERSHRKGEANKIGCLGEVIAERWMTRHLIAFKPELGNTKFDYDNSAHFTTINTKSLISFFLSHWSGTKMTLQVI